MASETGPFHATQEQVVTLSRIETGKIDKITFPGAFDREYRPSMNDWNI